jgi:tRNA modification GTPase
VNPTTPIDRERAAQTIAAIASAPGGARRGVVRLSGPGAKEIVAHAARFESSQALARRGVWPGVFFDGVGEQPVLVFWMPGPNSYTREDVAELHGPGAPSLVAALLRRVLELGARQARPGEFTRRAFENGRLDLTRAEGVLELVCASSESERRAASALLFGGLESHVAALRERLLDLRVLCEASLDFDEADTGHVPVEQLDALAGAAIAALDEALSFERRRVAPTGAPRVVLCGAPNAGKSTLFNALVGARAIVSPHAGTTRDVLKATWSVGELRFELVDTAGLEAPSSDRSSDLSGATASFHEAELEAQKRARAELDAADLALFVVRAAPAGELDSPELRAALAPLLAARELPRLLVWAQCDRADAPAAPPEALLTELRAREWIAVSAVDSRGLDELAAACRRRLHGDGAAPEAASAREISERHVAALERSREALAHARAALRAGSPLDLVAQTLRQALDALDEITGQTSPEDVLERLFSRFCIGK